VIDFTIERRIERGPREVFAHVSDPARLHTWQTNTVSAVKEAARGLSRELGAGRPAVPRAGA